VNLSPKNHRGGTSKPSWRCWHLKVSKIEKINSFIAPSIHFYVMMYSVMKQELMKRCTMCSESAGITCILSQLDLLSANPKSDSLCTVMVHVQRCLDATASQNWTLDGSTHLHFRSWMDAPYLHNFFFFDFKRIRETNCICVHSSAAVMWLL